MNSFENPDHWIILLSIAIVGIAVYSIIAVFIFFLYRSLKVILENHREERDVLRSIVDYHGVFFELHAKSGNKLDSIIKRQGKLGGLIGQIITEARKHDRRVAFLLEKLGETGPDDE